MKRLLTLCTLLLLLTFVHAGTLLAVSYNLYVAGVQVTSSNASDILGNHRVSYDAYSKTLTIYNCSIEAPAGKSAIENGIKGLIIEAAGNNVSISSSDGSEPVICTTADLTISNYTQSGFDISSRTGIAIRNEACTLTFNMGSSTSNPINVYGTMGGIVGRSTTAGNAKLVLDQVDMTIYSNVGDVFGQTSITANRVMATEPAGAYFTDQQLVNQRGQRVTGEAVIKACIPLGIVVGGVEVTDVNCEDVLGDGGSVVFWKEENALLLTNANITTDDQSAIRTEREDLIIALRGKNTLSYKGYYSYYYGLECCASTRLVNLDSRDNGLYYWYYDDELFKEATLTINSTTAAICNTDCSLNIEGIYGDLSLFLYGKQNQVLGKGKKSNNSIYVKDVRVYTGSCSAGVLTNQSSLDLNGVKVQTPGVAFSAEKGALLASDGTLQTNYTEICYDRYPVVVEGRQITQYNKDRIKAYQMSDGCYYDPENKILNLHEAYVWGRDCDAISLHDDITIRYYGTVVIEASGGYNCIYNSDGITTITGRADYSDAGVGIQLLLSTDGSTVINSEFGLVLDNATVFIMEPADAPAIYLADEPLVINNSWLTIPGNGVDPTISWCSGLNLSNGSVLPPFIRYDEVKKMFVDADGQEYTGDFGIFAIDVDNDGLLTPHDVEALSDIILEKPNDYLQLNIDFDGEKLITVSDIVKLNQFVELFNQK